MTGGSAVRPGEAGGPDGLSTTEAPGGIFVACLASGQAIDVAGKKNWALLAYLALNPGKSFSREKLVGLLWSDRGDAQARSSLRQAVALRRDLAEADPGISIAKGDTVAIAPSAISTDVAKFERIRRFNYKR